MNASDLIDVLAEWLEDIGVKVDLFAFDLHYGGLYRSETREIFINEPAAECALLTLAHEAGHHVGYVLVGHDRNDKRPALHHERQAYVYGWRVLQLIGANSLISRNRWIAECRASHECFVADQQSETPILARRFRG